MERNGVLYFWRTGESIREKPRGRFSSVCRCGAAGHRPLPQAPSVSMISFGSLRLVLTLLHAVSPSPSKCKQGFNL